MTLNSCPGLPHDRQNRQETEMSKSSIPTTPGVTAQTVNEVRELPGHETIRLKKVPSGWSGRIFPTHNP